MRTNQLTLLAALAMTLYTSAAQARRSNEPVIGQGGPLPPPVIRRVILRGMGPIRHCYQKALLSRPKLTGRVVVHFTISPRGRVRNSRVKSSTLGAPKVARCVAARVRRLIFPAPLGGGIVKVNYPFVFAPTPVRARPTTGRCKVDADCRLRICCCSYRVFGKGEPLCKPAPCACGAPIGPPPTARCRAGRCAIVHAQTQLPRPRQPRPLPLQAVPLASKERACKRNADCVFKPRSGCGCPPCGPTWRSAVNRKHAAWLRREYARESCPRHKCAKCSRRLRWLGSRTVCHRGQCAVRP